MLTRSAVTVYMEEIVKVQVTVFRNIPVLCMC